MTRTGDKPSCLTKQDGAVSAAANNKKQDLNVRGGAGE